jgi:hypothetical protein
MTVHVSNICFRYQLYVGLGAVLFLILGVVLHGMNAIISRRKPKDSKKPLLWVGGTILLALAALCSILFLLVPPLIGMLAGISEIEYACGQYTSSIIPSGGIL